MFEGGEGCGKSTQAAVLAAALGAVLTREPGGTDAGEHIRALLLDPALPPVGPRAETLLMLAARAEHVEQLIRPALEAGRDVVCDRFSGSTIAYQGYGRGLDPAELASLSAMGGRGLEPDLIVLLRVPPEVAAGRQSGRARTGVATDRIEGEAGDFHARLASGFDALAAADPSRWRVVDGVGTVEDVAARVSRAVGTVAPG